MRLITKASKDCEIKAFCAEEDLLVFGCSDYNSQRQHVTIRKMALAPNQVEQDVVMGFDISVGILSMKELELFADPLDDLGPHQVIHRDNYSIRETSGLRPGRWR